MASKPDPRDIATLREILAAQKEAEALLADLRAQFVRLGRELIASGVPGAAIARELGMKKQSLHDRLYRRRAPR